jgi:RNA polymerase sigma-70 factor (ECF subfamily)
LVLDRDEFGRLFAQHARLLWVVAAAFVPRPAVEDVLQDAAATALARLERFARGTDFGAWMAQIVRHTASNHGRRWRRRAEALDHEPMAKPATTPAVDRNGSVPSEQDAFDDATVRALAELAPDARACLLLQVVLDLGLAEIGTTLGLPEGTVASHVHRARRLLRARLRQEAPPPAATPVPHPMTAARNPR